MLFQDVVFWILSVMAVVGALGVVMVPDLFRAALLLIVVFIAVAGFFVLLSAEFLAVVQVLIYVGAIAILIIFAVMLTRDVQHGNLPNRMQIPAAVLAALLFAWRDLFDFLAWRDLFDVADVHLSTLSSSRNSRLRVARMT